jgi:hypothetical protein
MFELNRKNSRYTETEAQAAAEASRARAGEISRARHGGDEDDDGPECWLYCGVDCFIAWLDTRQCPRQPVPEPEPVPAVPQPLPTDLDPMCRRIVEVLQAAPDSTASQIAGRLGVRALRVQYHLRKHEKRLFVATGSRANAGSTGGPWGRTWRTTVQEQEQEPEMEEPHGIQTPNPAPGVQA